MRLKPEDGFLGTEKDKLRRGEMEMLLLSHCSWCCWAEAKVDKSITTVRASNRSVISTQPSAITSPL